MLQRYEIDAATARLRVRTRASGLLSRLAHDLEIAASTVTGHAHLDGEAWSADLVVPTAGLRVVGALHGQELDENALSANDRDQIERRLRDDVLAGKRAIDVRASGSDRRSGVAAVTLDARRQDGVALTLRVAVDAGTLTVSGSARVALSRLGVREVKGPLGAFRVADIIEVLWDLVLRERRD